MDTDTAKIAPRVNRVYRLESCDGQTNERGNAVILTEKRIEKLRATDKRQNFLDDQQSGFGLRIEPNGRKSFYYYAKVGGKVIFRALGEPPYTTVKEARAMATELAGRAASWRGRGFRDPNPFEADKPHKASSAPTFAALVEAYITGHIHDPKVGLNNPAKTEESLRWTMKKYCGEWMSRPVDSFTIADVLALRDSAGKAYYMANRLVQMVRALFAYCNEDTDAKTPVFPLPINPASKVSLFKEKKRERYLTPEELVILEAELEKPTTPRDLADFVKLALDTGARKSNILTMQWCEIDWDLKQWRIPKTKSGMPYTVDLLPRALEVLDRRRKELSTTDPCVFPRHHGETNLHIDVPFRNLMDRLGGTFTTVRVHDLRRTCGTVLARAGVSVQEIGACLGHSPLNLSSTLIYSKIAQAQLPAARQRAAENMEQLKEQARKRMKREKVAAIR
jgi:integrase